VNPQDLKQQIIALTRQYSALVHKAQRPAESNPLEFIPGQTVIPYAGRVFTEDEVAAAVSSSLDFWLTLGVQGKAFEVGLSQFLGTQLSVLVNSGSSANLVAISALTTHKLPTEKRLQPGDEVITCAAGFPTTVGPIIQNNLTAVFLDADPLSGNAKLDQLEAAYIPGKTKAVMLAHTLGNPFDLARVVDFCRKNNLWLIEDNCDALGSTYTLPAAHPLTPFFRKKTDNSNAEVTKHTGAWGDLSTQSFYPPHHLTLGEGGAVNIVSNRRLRLYVESFRDWGRDCWCDSGKDNTCNKRFGWKLGELPFGYDHKYIYSHLGYNLKPLDIQAAIGCEQLKKLPAFVQARIDNWNTLRAGLADLEEFFEFSLPTHATGWTPNGFTWKDNAPRCTPSWFGFMLLIKPTAPFTRAEFVNALVEAKIGNRMLFGGNLTRQPAFIEIKKVRPNAFRTIGDLSGADTLMNQAVFIGTYPGLTAAMLEYMIANIHRFVKHSRR
jgi:CDP-4-dehydro-6-deoxyglucose reductase, E1